MHPARDQVVARAFRRGARQQRRFDIDEAVRVQEGTQPVRNSRPLAQALLHLGPAQVDIAIAQPGLLADVGVFQLERRRVGGIQHLQLDTQHFHSPGRQVRIQRSLRAAAHPSPDLQDILVADPFRRGEGGLGIRVEDNLHQSPVIAQVHEDHSAMIAAAMHPAAQGDFPVEMGFVQIATVETAHGHNFRLVRSA